MERTPIHDLPESVAARVKNLPFSASYLSLEGSSHYHINKVSCPIRIFGLPLARTYRGRVLSLAIVRCLLEARDLID